MGERSPSSGWPACWLPVPCVSSMVRGEQIRGPSTTLDRRRGPQRDHPGLFGGSPGTLWGSRSPPMLHGVTNSERHRNPLHGRRVQVSGSEDLVFPCGHGWCTGRSSVCPSCSPAQRGSSGCWDLPLWVTSTLGPRMGGFLPELFPAPSCTPPLPKPVSTFQHEAGMFLLSYF